MNQNEFISLPTETVAQKKLDGEALDTRMKSAYMCRQMVQRAVVKDQVRSLRRARAKGCLDGNPTTTRTIPGFSWVCRLNFGELEGIMDSSRIPYWALFSGVPTYATFKTRYRGAEEDACRWDNIIADKWTALLNRWKTFKWHMQASEFEMLFDGWGPVIFDDPNDWRFTSVPARCVKVQQKSHSCIDDRLPYVIVLRDWQVHELWRKIADEEAATAMGWNVPQVKHAIKNACNWGTRTQYDYEHWQQELRNGDVAVSEQADVIKCGKVYLMEYAKGGKPGRISELVVTYDDVGKPSDETNKQREGEDYLYKKVGQYATYDEVINVSFQNTGDGTWHSVRGIGLKAFPHVEVMNRTLGKAVDNAFLAAMPIIQPGTNNSGDARQLMVMGPVATLAPGANVVQTRIAADAAGILAINRVVANKLYGNIGHFNQGELSRDDGRGETITATEAELKAGRSTSLRQAQIDNRYGDLDAIYQEMFARVMRQPDEESKRFVKECREAGVPMEALKNMETVRANRLSGYPSPETRKRNFREGYSLFPSLPEQGKSNMLDEGITIYFGADKIDVFNPKVQKPNSDSWMANSENSDLLAGVQPEVISGMNNVLHLQIHLGFADEKLSPLQQAMEAGQTIPEEQLQETLAYVSVLGAHCEQHLAPLEGDPGRKDLYKLFSDQLKNMVSFHSDLRNAILAARREAEQAAMEQQQATALGAMDQAKLESAQAEIQRNDAKAANDMRIKTAKAEHSMQISTFKTGAQTRLKAATAMADTQIKKQTAEANGSNGKK